MANLARVLCAAVIGLSTFARCIQLEDFYPFGSAAGDRELGREDDGFSDPPLHLQRPFPYYDRDENTLYVSEVLQFTRTVHFSRNRSDMQFEFPGIAIIKI